MAIFKRLPYVRAFHCQDGSFGLPSNVSPRRRRRESRTRCGPGPRPLVSAQAPEGTPSIVCAARSIKGTISAPRDNTHSMAT